jgi:hypothetical protein
LKEDVGWDPEAIPGYPAFVSFDFGAPGAIGNLRLVEAVIHN